jgi:hypothetical protein
VLGAGATSCHLIARTALEHGLRSGTEQR